MLFRSLFTLALWLEGDLANLPKVLDHRRRVAERPAVKKAIAEELGSARQ